MAQHRRRILFVGEASFLATGFGVYYNEVLKRLHKTGKFEIAEIGGYASVDDNRIHGIPWKFYPTMPSQGDQQGIEKYRSSPTAQFGEHVFDSACLEFKPDIVCVVPGAPIETTSGPVPIEHINVGDYVLTHTGAFRQVRKVYVRPYQGEVVRILLESDSVPIKVTPNHKLLVLRNCDNNPEWIAASYLTKSDRLFLPKMQAITPDDYIDVLDYISNEVLSNQVTVTHCNKTEQLPRRLLVDKDFAYFLGFVSRRLWNPADYEYSAVYNVPDDIRRIYNLKFGKAFSGSTIKFRGDLLQSLFVNMLGGDRIPRAIYLSPSWTTVKAFVRGVLLRRIDIAGVAGSVRYSDSSERFVRQLRNMLWRFGIRGTIGGAKNKWTLTFFDESAGVILAITGDKPCEPLYHDLSHPEAVKIRTIIKGREYSGLVYNLEVDGDNSYVTTCAVHNCDVRDFWMCLTNGTPIITGDGTVKLIQDIAIGDRVLSHAGKTRLVVRTFSRKYSGTIHTIRCGNMSAAIELTDDHPVLALKRDKLRLLNESWDTQPTWKKSQELTKDDFLCFPIPKETADDDKYSMDACRFLGYYAAQGCLMYEGKCENGALKGIQLTFGAHKKEYADDAVALIDSLFFNTAKVKEVGNVIIIRAHSAGVASFCKSAIGEHAAHKTLAPEIVRLPAAKVAQFLCGLFRGDGCNYKRQSYCTASRDLAYQVWNMCVRLGLAPTMAYNQNRISKKVFYRYLFGFQADLTVRGYKEIYEQGIPPTSRDLRHANNDYVFMTIKSIDHRQVIDEQVYNFEVDVDNSYVTSFAVHNCEFQERAPSRHLWTMLWMPTVDGLPQKDLWIDSYKKCDHILTYSQFGYDALKDAGLKNLLGLASPGSDLEIFKPVPDKRAHKKQCGIDPDALIVGTTARNQSRKLFYDLIEAFATWYNQTLRTNEKLARRAFLYLHTSYPDVGYDIGRAARECKIGSRILMTYMCDKCRATYPSRFAGERTTCRACGSVDAHPPNANASVSREALAAIMNLFDVYVQYSVCWSAGAPVAMADGTQMPIESIEVGQQVLSHIGQAKTVTKVLRRPAVDLLKIIIDGDTSSYTCTPDHPIFTKRGFVAASQLQIGDYVGAPIHTPGSQPIDIDPELLGNLIGGFHYGARDAAVCAVLDWSRARYVDALVSRCSRAGCDVEINERKHQGTNVVIRQLPIWVQQAVKNHILPSISWTDDQIAKLIRGLVDSVGSLDDAGYRMGFRRRDMADIVRRLAARIGILLDIYYHGGRKAWYLRTHVVFAKRIIDTIMGKLGNPIPIDASRTLGLLIADGYIWSRVNGILPMAPKDQIVYNLEVEDDHSYVVGSIGSHNCEGWGMPITEAKSLGLPTMCVNYSAMEDHVKSTGGIAIDVGRYYHESLQQTEQRRALPDNYDFGRKLTGIFKKSEAERKMLSQKIRAWVEEPIKVPGELRKLPRFSWDYTAAVWEHWLETIPTKDRTTTWDSPVPNLLPMPQNPPNNMTNTEFVHWIITNTIGKQWCRTPMADEWIRALNIGCRFVGPNKMPVDRQAVWNAFCDRVKAHNDFEQQRIGRDKFNALPTTQQYLTL